jgi:hypothetical protein
MSKYPNYLANIHELGLLCLHILFAFTLKSQY